MKNLKSFNEFRINENNYHEPPTPNVNPYGYEIGDKYYYVNESLPLFYIENIKNGSVHSVSMDGKTQDNPSTQELNNLIKNKKVVIKTNINDLEEEEKEF